MASDPRVPGRKRGIPDLERFSDRVTDLLGSTASVLAHTAIFGAALALYFLGADINEVLLVLTTGVALEAIYLSIFIQRSTNRQAARVEAAVEDIRRNTEETLARLSALTVREIDDVQAAVEDIEGKIEAAARRIEGALRDGRAGAGPDR